MLGTFLLFACVADMESAGCAAELSWGGDACDAAVGVVADVGAEKLLSLIGDVGESRSLVPDESFVLFFFRNPSYGSKTDVSV